MNFVRKLIENYEKYLGNFIPLRFVIFLFVGGINTIFGYGIFALFIYLKLHYILASVVSTVMVMINKSNKVAVTLKPFSLKEPRNFLSLAVVNLAYKA
jgi:hypothetical protein